MKASIQLTALDTPELTADAISIEVEYSVEEFIALAKACPEVLSQIITLTKELS